MGLTDLDRYSPEVRQVMLESAEALCTEIRSRGVEIGLSLFLDAVAAADEKLTAKYAEITEENDGLDPLSKARVNVSEKCKALTEGSLRWLLKGTSVDIMEFAQALLDLRALNGTEH